MNKNWVWKHSELFIVLLGMVLFILAVTHHIGELLFLNEVLGPTIALLLDGLPAVGIMYGGYWLSQIESTLEHRRRVVLWALSGGLIFVTVIGATFLVRIMEGRTVAEPVFPLLIALEAGIVAGLIAGYHSGKARAEARHAQSVTDALTFVNNLIRHDLRNDLSVVKGHSTRLESDQSEFKGGNERDPAVIISENTDEALTLIETTHAITDTLVGESDFGSIDLAAIVTELVPHIESAYSATVTTELPDQALVSANEGLRSVVDNLVENAVQHNDGDVPHVTVGVTTDATIVTLTVSDNGPGIPEPQQERLFDTNTTDTGGSGLTLIKTLVDAYNGSIRVEDNEPQGTSFVVELPRADSSL